MAIAVTLILAVLLGLILIGRSTKDTRGMVRLYDPEARKVLEVPESSLPKGMIQVQIQGSTDLVWCDPSKLQQGPIRHGPFGEDIRDYLRKIQSAFAEHRKITLEEWEDGFRRDANPEQEIAIWIYAAGEYTKFATSEPSPARRAEAYSTIVACMSSRPDQVWKLLNPVNLTRPETESLVNSFYKKKQ